MRCINLIASDFRARIYDLKDQGVNIETELIEIMSDGKKNRVARYSIKK